MSAVAVNLLCGQLWQEVLCGRNCEAEARSWREKVRKYFNVSDTDKESTHPSR